MFSSLNRVAGLGLIDQFRSMAAMALMNGYIPVRRSLLWIIESILTPLSFVFLILIIGRSEAIPHALIGALVMAMTTSSTGLIGDILWFRNNLKIQSMIAASPMHPASYILGLSLSAYIYGFPAIAGFIALSYLLGVARDLWFIAVAIATLTILWITTSTISFLVATLIKTERLAWPLSSIMGVALSIFPPVYYPLEITPPELRYYLLIPITASTAELMRSLTGLSSLGGEYVAFILGNIAIQVAVSLILLAKKFRWREK